MYLRLAKRMLFETDKRLVWKLAWNMGVKGMRAIHRHKRRLKRGEFFPPYLYISIINSCNLRCQGCWVDVAHKQKKIELDALDRMIREAKAMGNSFFGLLGGEPFMHKELLELLGRHPDAYFQVFTNGHFITPEVAQKLRRLGNVTPLVSVEGTNLVSDERRGRAGVLDQTLAGLQNCLDAKVLTGVCTSLCQSNYSDLLREEWIDRLIDMGVMYTWYHIYRPVGPLPNADLALTLDQQREGATIRGRYAGQEADHHRCLLRRGWHQLCPAATGFTHHINPWETSTCPIIQFAKESIHDPRPLKGSVQRVGVSA
ncbi:MAG: radical SAM/SPASM domain-containing protein [Pirellulaceae bacterium]